MLELYQAEDCPHCTRVREQLAELGLSYVTHNPRNARGHTRNEQTHAELTTIGGKDQVPLLVDTNRQETIYESDDIIAYLQRHYARPALAP